MDFLYEKRAASAYSKMYLLFVASVISSYIYADLSGEE
jgi:hypothetical protein